jgi:hypothetical protein
MRKIRFERPPAVVTLGEAIRLAARYWRETADRWVLAVVAVALATTLAEWLLGGSVLNQDTFSRMLVPGSVNQIDPSELPKILAGPLEVGLVSLVAGWFFAANAIAGLRAREVTLGWVVAAGLRSFLASMILALAFGSIVLVALALGTLGVVLLLALLLVAIYVGIRLVFWTLAIFDGTGIDAGARQSWALTRGAVLRVLGWGLAAFGLALVVTIIDIVIEVLLAGIPVAGAFVTATLDAALQAFTILLMAILYESQLGRSLGVPAAGRPWPSSQADADGPPPPPPPPSDPWRG